MATDLPTLPEDVLLQVLPHLDAVSLARFSMMCKFLYETIKESPLMTYTIELYLNGMVDSRETIVEPYLELINRLRRRRQAYVTPMWIKNTTVYMQFLGINTNLVGGIFVSNSPSRSELGVLPVSYGISEPQLSSPRPNNIGTSILNVNLDPSQDLFVLVENEPFDGPTDYVDDVPRTVRIHLRTIFEDDPHPRARKKALEYIIIPTGIQGTYLHTSSLYIEGHILAHYYFCGEDPGRTQPRVLIWDWTTSELILDSSSSSPALLPTLLSRFHLIDSRHFFVLSELNSGSIKMYKLASNGTSSIHLVTLHLPLCAPSVHISGLNSHAGPTGPHFRSSTQYLRVNDDDRLHVFTFDYEYPGAMFIGEYNIPNLKYLDLFVHQRMFAQYFYLEMAPMTDLPLDMPWAKWGSANTKILWPSRIQNAYAGLRDIHGQRVVLPVFRGSNLRLYPETNSVEILDFSLAAILSVGHHDPLENDDAGLLLPPTMIKTSEIPLFLDDVETHLPCVSFTTDLDRTYTSFRIHADGFVGTNMGPSRGNAIVDAYTI
ncbi:hypothetical protein BDN70DRAFT_889499 [Pholiota conissans]|uniref:F-box domain-containing protein n=1 Tax=Pholiota conissans TaxID=109636 RepID=A0A9P5ZHT2_9AGAR|nr:hypothetical protein BDN70DRAFT_889499 [Pholiota conissans]